MKKKILILIAILFLIGLVATLFITTCGVGEPCERNRTYLSGAPQSIQGTLLVKSVTSEEGVKDVVYKIRVSEMSAISIPVDDGEIQKCIDHKNETPIRLQGLYYKKNNQSIIKYPHLEPPSKESSLDFLSFGIELIEPNSNFKIEI